MLHEIFYWIFNMSIAASLVGLIVMLIRRIKKLPRRLVSVLWVIPFLRLTVPLWVNSQYSLMAVLSRFSTRTVVVYKPVEDVSFSMMNCITFADTYFPITYKVDVLEDIFRIASTVWITVSLAILLMLAVMYFITLHEIKDSAHLKDNIYISGKVMSPAVYGIFKPKIILPASYNSKSTELIILHEQAHIRNFDNLWRIAAFITTAFHWFNPLCWVFLKSYLNDLELSCDERVIAKLGDERKKEYALSLIESKQGTTVFASAFGGAKIRTRIENILSFKKITRFSLIVFSAFAVIIFYVLLTNAV